jgi:hypothetical protein
MVDCEINGGELQLMKPVCVFIYGAFSDSSLRQRLIATRPQFVVVETAGGSYKRTAVTPAMIKELKDTGIKVLSYVSTGGMVNFKYAEDSPINDRPYIRGCISAVAAEGCDGIWFDESGVGYHPCIIDRYLKAPATDLYGNSNSWSGYTMEDYTNYAHSLGLFVICGNASNESQFTKSNAFDKGFLDFIFMREESGSPPAPIPAGQELLGPGKCQILGSGFTDAVTAAAHSNGALKNGFGLVYSCNSYGSLPSWFEDYMSRIPDSEVIPQEEIMVTFTGTLKDTAGNNLSGKTVTITVGSDILTATTTSSGFTTSKVYAQGTYTATVSFAGDGTYKGSSDTKPFTVSADKIETVISLTVTVS